MVLQYLVVIQLVDTVTGSNNYIWLVRFLKESDVLVDRIGCSSVPEAIVVSNSRVKYIKSALLTSEVPPLRRA